jgi:hypothetical protein
MKGYIPLNIVPAQSPKNVRSNPNLLEASYHFPVFLLISFMLEDFFICLHCAIDGVTLGVPQYYPYMKLLLSECNLYPLTPYRPEELGT